MDRVKLKEHVKKSDRLVLAVSGGVDSVVLLDIISKTHPTKNLLIAHVNHGIREGSSKDREFVSGLAKEKNILFKSTNLKLKRTDENTAREARYEWLKQVSRDFGAKYIVTAHHLDDQLETIILNLVRGTGPVGLWGMKEVSSGVLRPLLSIEREEIEKYARDNKLDFVEDETNEDISYRRNRVRKNVVPELKKINEKALSNLRNSVELASELASFVDIEVSKIFLSKFEVSSLKEAHPFIAKEAIKRKMHEMIGKQSDIYRKNVEEVYQLIFKSGTKRTEIAGMVIEKDYNHLKFDFNSSAAEKKLDILIGGTVDFNGFVIKSRKGSGEPCKNNILITKDFEYNLKVRNWEVGDKIKMKSGTKKISDIFTDAKISQHERKKWPIIISGEEIIWVPKLAASAHGLSCLSEDCLILEVK